MNRTQRIPEPRPAPKEDKRTIAQIRESRKRLEVRVSEQRLQVEQQILENFLGDFYGGWDFGGSDLFFELRLGGGQTTIPPSVYGDRRHGQNWPVWRNDIELARLRQVSRMLCASNAYARGLLRNNTNYVIGRGFTYKCQGVKDLPKGYEQETVDGFVKGTQRVVDEFLKRTRWNGQLDPRRLETIPTNTREREGYRRVYRDGDGLLRFFFLDGGQTDVRWMEPEQLRNPARGPNGEPGDYTHGWTYGIRHRMQPAEDTEAAEVYHFMFKDLATPQTNAKKDADGEFVPADEIVHIKPPDEDAAVKRGTPAFSFEVAEALMRASKIQRFLSQSAAVRAATAEIWKHTVGTQAQMSQLAQGHLSPYQKDPVSQLPDVLQRYHGGGITRRVPAGQEPVMIPENNATTQQLEAAQGDLRQAGAAFSSPEYLVSGSAENANYSSTKEAGTPYTNSAKADQEHFKSAYLLCIWKAVTWAVKCNRLPREVLDVVEIQVEAPEIVGTDKGQKAQEDALLTQVKAKSPQTLAMEHGLDPDHEMGNWEEFEERLGGMGQALGMPDESGNLPGQNRANALESLLLESGFSGTLTDRLGRKITYRDGLRVSGSADHDKDGERGSAQTDKAIAGTLKKAAGLKGKMKAAFRTVANKAVSIYKDLEKKHGRAAAIGILAAGHALGLATPMAVVPGSTFLATAAVAKAYELAKRGLKATGAIESMDCAEPDVKAEALRVWQELLKAAKEEASAATGA